MKTLNLFAIMITIICCVSCSSNNIDNSNININHDTVEIDTIEYDDTELDSLLFFGGDSLITIEDIKKAEIDDQVAFALQKEKPVFVLDTANLIAEICHNEGWRSRSYKCTKGVTTIGHGITNMGVREINRILGTDYKLIKAGDCITKEESIRFMKDYCRCADVYFKVNYKGWRQVLPYVKTSIMSYCYQRGWYRFDEKVMGKGKGYAMRKALHEGDNDMIIKLLEENTLNDGYRSRREHEIANAKKIFKTKYYAALNDWRKNNLN